MFPIVWSSSPLKLFYCCFLSVLISLAGVWKVLSWYDWRRRGLLFSLIPSSMFWLPPENMGLFGSYYLVPELNPWLVILKFITSSYLILFPSTLFIFLKWISSLYTPSTVIGSSSSFPISKVLWLTFYLLADLSVSCWDTLFLRVLPPWPNLPYWVLLYSISDLTSLLTRLSSCALLALRIPSTSSTLSLSYWFSKLSCVFSTSLVSRSLSVFSICSLRWVFALRSSVTAFTEWINLSAWASYFCLSKKVVPVVAILAN